MTDAVTTNTTSSNESPPSGQQRASSATYSNSQKSSTSIPTTLQGAIEQLQKTLTSNYRLPKKDHNKSRDDIGQMGSVHNYNSPAEDDEHPSASMPQVQSLSTLSDSSQDFTDPIHSKGETTVSWCSIIYNWANSRIHHTPFQLPEIITKNKSKKFIRRLDDDFVAKIRVTDDGVEWHNIGTTVEIDMSAARKQECIEAIYALNQTLKPKTRALDLKWVLQEFWIAIFKLLVVLAEVLGIPGTLLLLFTGFTHLALICSVVMFITTFVYQRGTFFKTARDTIESLFEYGVIKTFTSKPKELEKLTHNIHDNECGIHLLDIFIAQQKFDLHATTATVPGHEAPTSGNTTPTEDEDNAKKAAKTAKICQVAKSFIIFIVLTLSFVMVLCGGIAPVFKSLFSLNRTLEFFMATGAFYTVIGILALINTLIIAHTILAAISIFYRHEVKHKIAKFVTILCIPIVCIVASVALIHLVSPVLILVASNVVLATFSFLVKFFLSGQEQASIVASSIPYANVELPYKKELQEMREKLEVKYNKLNNRIEQYTNNAIQIDRTHLQRAIRAHVNTISEKDNKIQAHEHNLREHKNTIVTLYQNLKDNAEKIVELEVSTRTTLLEFETLGRNNISMMYSPRRA